MWTFPVALTTSSDCYKLKNICIYVYIYIYIYIYIYHDKNQTHKAREQKSK